LVSASGIGDGGLALEVEAVADFILLHFNSVSVDAIPKCIEASRKASKAMKAIVCNEDDKTGQEAARALEAAVKSRCSWGYMNKEQNQFYPFKFEGAADDALVYAKLKELSSAP